MTIENKAWWRGSFPAWIVAGLMGMVSWMGFRLVNEHDAVVARSLSNTERIQYNEISLKYQSEQIAELKAINRMIADQFERLRNELKTR